MGAFCIPAELHRCIVAASYGESVEANEGLISDEESEMDPLEFTLGRKRWPSKR